ncbi:MAG: hypothetical protein AAF215_00490 [Cyanobacteria bacterium P01_A01_bin.123]
MDTTMRARTYTKVAKWYNLACLAFTTLSSVILLTSIVLDPYNFGTTTDQVFRSIAITLAGIAGIVGMIQDKQWAKWVTIFVYGLYIFAAIQGLIISFSLDPVHILFLLDKNRVIALRLVHLTAILMFSIGVILFLQKPHLRGNVGEGKELEE